MKRQRRRRPRSGVPLKKLLCVGCRSELVVAMQTLERHDGLVGGWFPLCRACYAQFLALPTRAAQDFFLDCLVEELTWQAGRGA